MKEIKCFKFKRKLIKNYLKVQTLLKKNQIINKILIYYYKMHYNQMKIKSNY